MTNRRQFFTRAILILGVLLAVLAGLGIVRNAGPRAKAREAVEALKAAASEEQRFGETGARAWLAESAERQRDFAALQSFLTEQDVADVVPAWTLLLTDPVRLERCGGSAFMLAPRREWANIVPALRLVRDVVKPAVGAVRVVSVYRDPALNRCAGGAGQSRHLSFSALDLVPLETRDARDAFTRLCSAWRRGGARSGWGLGAYFDVTRPAQNAAARFHVDGTAWRTWGFSRRGPSSGCHSLR